MSLSVDLTDPTNPMWAAQCQSCPYFNAFVPFWIQGPGQSEDGGEPEARARLWARKPCPKCGGKTWAIGPVYSGEAAKMRDPLEGVEVVTADLPADAPIGQEGERK